MKTIRQNTFETNSSSTHSVTIQRGGTGNDEREFRKVVIDNVLYPENLRHSSAYMEAGYDGHILKCTTRDEKAAVFIHYLNNSTYTLCELYDGNDDDEYEAFEAQAQAIIVWAIDELQRQLHYTNISNRSVSAFYPYSEDGDDIIVNLFDEDGNEDQTKANIIEFIKDVILDDDATIIDQESSY